MRTPIKRLSAIGSAVGLVLVASAITPAVAAPVPMAFTATGCSSFKGATTTDSQPYFPNVALRAGDTITARVSPSSEGDTISVFAGYSSPTSILNMHGDEGAASGFDYIAPSDGYYNLTYSFHGTSPTGDSLTWSFDATCSSAIVSSSPDPAPTTKPSKGGGKGGGKAGGKSR